MRTPLFSSPADLMANRLANETSPYLLQHAHNPVDWYPWGPEALARAAAEDRPILLSIGYAACHWCHVMERESFEDEATAALMNEHFVCVKVDREERPDLDSIYMHATQAMTGHGGWPMTVFLTPAGEPFFCGTYYPPDDRHGMPSFRRVLAAVNDAWTRRRGGITEAAGAVRALYAQMSEKTRATGPLSPQVLERAYRGLAQQYDAQHGGFGGAPKFPQAMAMDFLLRFWRRRGTGEALEMVRDTFRHMARGGVYDQVGGGFHRYAVDAIWLVPHFEKMLYDNALMSRLGVQLWQATGDAEVREVVEQTLAWVKREMTTADGAFHSTLDADSEGHEGKFYVWSESELRELLGADAAAAIEYWGVTPGGNFEGHSILTVAADPATTARRLGVDEHELRASIARARATLLQARERRVRPARDDKVLAGWNGLMMRAVADAARAFGSDELRRLAVANGEAMATTMVRDGRVMRVRKNEFAPTGFLEDYGALGLGILSLYELTFEPRWLDAARFLAQSSIRLFWDDDVGAFFDTAADAEKLVTRPRDTTDNATPAGTSLATELLLKVGELTQDTELARRGSWVLETTAEPMARFPTAFGHLLGAADLAIHGGVELALVGRPDSPDFVALAGAAGRTYAPSLIVAGGPPAEDSVALLANRPMVNDRATAYVCHRYTCDAPTTDGDELAAQLAAAGR